MPHIRAIIFDIDGVLCHLDDRKRVESLSQLSPLSADEIHEAIWASGFEDLSDAGHYDAEEYLAEFGRRIGHPITHEEWCECRQAGMAPIQEVLDMARALSDDREVALLTNNGEQFKRAFPILFPELDEMLGHKLYVSSDFKKRKPDPTIYLEVCEKIGVQPSETLMVDDRDENIVGAIQAGLQGHHFKDHHGLREALQL